MQKKNILWISRHPLWRVQIGLLHSLHGKKCAIDQKPFRFVNFDQFCDVLDQFQNHYYIYAVVPEKWRERALELGYSLGVVHRPQSVKNIGKRKHVFRIEYTVGEVVKTKRKGKVYNTKGYRKSKKRS